MWQRCGQSLTDQLSSARQSRQHADGPGRKQSCRRSVAPGRALSAPIRLACERSPEYCPAVLARKASLPLAVIGVAVAVGLLASCGSESANNDSANDAARDAIEDTRVDPSGELAYEHFFYFDDEDGARGVERALTDQGFVVTLYPPGDGVDEWSVIGIQSAALEADELDELTLRMESLASEFGGVYDGWGAPVG